VTFKPDRSTTAGTVYLDLRKLAKDTHRPTDELHQLYALEGFLDRLSRSSHHPNFVLKGGVLLAAYAERRPTRGGETSWTSRRSPRPKSTKRYSRKPSAD
jgi:hypothetical protein